MDTLCKMALVVAVMVIVGILLFAAEENCLDYGCFKMSPFNCNNCKRKCKWKYILKDYKETED